MHNTRTTRNSGMYCCCYTHWGTYQQELRCAVFFLLLSQMQSQEAHASLHEELQPAAVGHKITDKIVLLVLPSQARVKTLDCIIWGQTKKKNSPWNKSEKGSDETKSITSPPQPLRSPGDPLFISVLADNGLPCSSPSWSRNDEFPTSAITRTISVLGKDKRAV